MRKKPVKLIFAGMLGISVASFSANAQSMAAGYYPANDHRTNIIAMGADFLIVRPLTFALTVAGGSFWLVTLPVSAIGGNVGEAGDKLFLEPGRYTFLRPLGHMQLDDSPILGDPVSDPSK